MVESGPQKAEESKNKKKAKKIILKPLFYSDLDLSSIPVLAGKKNELDEFKRLIIRTKDKIDLIYINPSRSLDGLAQSHPRLHFQMKNRVCMAAKPMPKPTRTMSPIIKSAPKAILVPAGFMGWLPALTNKPGR